MPRSQGVRPLTTEEYQQLSAGLRSSQAFVLRRSQIILACARSERPAQIVATIGCSRQTVRSAVAAFNRNGLESLERKATRPHTVQTAFDTDAVNGLWDMLHHSPRIYRRPADIWTLGLAAEVSFAQGLVKRPVTGETVRATLFRLGVPWQRARQLLHHPDPFLLQRRLRHAG